MVTPHAARTSARLVVLDVLEARQLVGESAHVAAALHVVLPAQRVEARAPAPDVAGEQREVDQESTLSTPLWCSVMPSVQQS
jgi:hypothetical protein